MNPKFHAASLIILSAIVFGYAMGLALDPDGVWVNEWGYIQKLGTLLVLALTGYTAISAGATLVDQVQDEDDLDAEIERVTRNPRLPQVEVE